VLRVKYTILCFNQEKALELGFDVEDLLIIRWFVDFYSSSKMIKMNVGDKTYAWVNYSRVIEDIPILNMKKDTLSRRMKKICETGIMEHETLKQGGTFSLYKLTDKYDQLISTDKKTEGTDKKTEGTEKIPEGYGKNSQPVTDKNPEQNINLLNNNSIKDINTYSTKEELLHPKNEDVGKNRKKESVNSVIAEYTESKDLQDALHDFVDMRTKARKPLTVRAMKLSLNELDKLAVDDVTKIAIVNQSIMHNWLTFYKLQNNNNGGQRQLTRKEMGYAF
jgi:hypothetical protein